MHAEMEITPAGRPSDFNKNLLWLHRSEPARSGAEGFIPADSVDSGDVERAKRTAPFAAAESDASIASPAPAAPSLAPTVPAASAAPLSHQNIIKLNHSVLLIYCTIGSLVYIIIHPEFVPPLVQIVHVEVERDLRGVAAEFGD